MNTRLLPADPENIALAAQLIRQGKLVGFPTETVYGLGADALNAQAVLDIFAAKGRPADNPLIVHIARFEEMAPLCHINAMAKKLADAFWPGPLTMILPKKETVPAAVTAGLLSVAIRMPEHPVARALIAESGCPIAAPSGNRSGRPSPTLATHMLEDMDRRIPLILDGGPYARNDRRHAGRMPGGRQRDAALKGGRSRAFSRHEAQALRAKGPYDAVRRRRGGGIQPHQSRVRRPASR